MEELQPIKKRMEKAEGWRGSSTTAMARRRREFLESVDHAVRDSFASYSIACGAWAPSDQMKPKKIAKIAYDLADAMMAERKKRNPL